MAIPRPGMGIVQSDYSGDGVVVARRVEFMAVPVPGLEIPASLISAASGSSTAAVAWRPMAVALRAWRYQAPAWGQVKHKPGVDATSSD